jgi:predicted amidohydrolase
MTRRVKVAACQILTYPELSKSATKIIKWLKKAAQEKVEIVLFPEAALCGYTCSDNYWKQAQPSEFIRAEHRVIRVARQLNIAVILGSAYWKEGKWYNTLLLVDNQGKIVGRYAKTHLAEKWTTPGKELRVFKLLDIPVCCIICHDIRYPELVRLPAMVGAKICFFSSCESGLIKEFKLTAYRGMPVARAAENGIFLVMANVPADPQDLRKGSHGNSKIIHPTGQIIEEAGFFEERLVIAELELKDATGEFAKRAENDETVLKDWLKKGKKLVLSF